MARARGANIVVAAAMAASYGAVPAAGSRRYPVVSIGLGEEQGLMASDTLGNGRDPQEAGDDVVDDEGPLVTPVDLRNFGFWLRLLMGDPVTTAGIAGDRGGDLQRPAGEQCGRDLQRHRCDLCQRRALGRAGADRRDPG